MRRVAMLMMAAICLGRPLEVAAVMCGDLTGNDQIDTADVVLLFRAVLENPDPAPLCKGAGALACGDVVPLNAPDGQITTGDTVGLFQTVLNDAPPVPYMVCDVGSCESQMGLSQWNAAFGGSIQAINPATLPPSEPTQCESAFGATRITSGPGGAVVVGADEGYTGSPRVTDASFLVRAEDIAAFGHIFVGSAEQNASGGRIGIAVGDVGYEGVPTTMYIEFVRKSGSLPGCFLPGDGLDEGAYINENHPDNPGPSDDTWWFYPGEGGVVLPPIQANRWYRIASIAGRRNDGGISVTATWQDLTTLEQSAVSMDFPPECTPTWWDTADHRPQHGIATRAGSGSPAKAEIADLFVRPGRF